jgi:hypothetical protein
MRTTIYAAAAAAGLLLSTPAAAATADFDDIPNTGNGIQTAVTSGGMNFAGAHFHILDSPDTRIVRNASTSYLGAEAAQGLGQPVTFTRTDASLFTLNSVDVAELWLPGEPLNDFMDVVFSGLQSGGGMLSLTFTLDGIRDGAGGVADFQTVMFAGWTNLQSVTVTGRNANGAFGDYAIDNVVFNDDGAVPEPTTWALLILGFGMVGHRIRQRRRPSLIFMQA